MERGGTNKTPQQKLVKIQVGRVIRKSRLRSCFVPSTRHRKLGPPQQLLEVIAPAQGSRAVLEAHLPGTKHRAPGRAAGMCAGSCPCPREPKGVVASTVGLLGSPEAPSNTQGPLGVQAAAVSHSSQELRWVLAPR